MAITLPHTLVASTNENVTDVQDNFTTLKNLFPLSNDSTTFSAVAQCHAYISDIGITNVPSGTPTTAPLLSEVYDQGTQSSNMHDTAVDNSRLVCRVAGLYNIIGRVFFTTGTGTRGIRLLLNGSTVLAHTSVTGAAGAVYTGPFVETCYRLAVDDYIEFAGYQTSGATLSMAGPPTTSVDEASLRMCWVSL